MRLPRRPGAVVFDMDGLLFNTEALYRDAVIAAAAEYGYELPLQAYLDTLGTTTEETRTRLASRLDSGFDFDAFWATSARIFRETAGNGLRLKTGVTELLDELDRTGLPRAIASSARYARVRSNLDAHGIASRFHAVVACEDYARGKPDPEPFLIASRRLEVPPEDCLALEDSFNGIRAACSAGMMTVMVPDLLDPTEEMITLSASIAADLVEVRDMVRVALI